MLLHVVMLGWFMSRLLRTYHAEMDGTNSYSNFHLMILLLMLRLCLLLLLRLLLLLLLFYCCSCHHCCCYYCLILKLILPPPAAVVAATAAADKRLFYNRFGTFFASWFLTLPLETLIAVGLPAWDRSRVVIGMRLTVRTVW